MKKTFALSLICAGLLSACQPESTSAPEPVQSETSPTEVAPVEAPVMVSPQAALIKAVPISTDGVPNFSQDCNIEGVDGILFTGDQLVISKSTKHEITGWLINPLEKTLGNNLKLVIAGVGNTPDVWTSEVATRIDRAGVAETRAYAPELANSGFSFSVDMNAVATGEYHVFVMLANGGSVAMCDPGRQIKVID
jgi:hypothetical protein